MTLDEERLEIIKNTPNPEKITAGLNRRDGHTALIKHYKLRRAIELGVRGAEMSRHLVANTELTSTFGVDINFCNDAVHLQHMYPTQYQFNHGNSLDVHVKFDDNYFDLIHVDDWHEESHVSKEIPIWYKKLKIGGIMSFDDFMDIEGQAEPFGVQTALNNFCKQYNIQYYIIGLDTSDLKVINDFGTYKGQQRDRRFKGLSHDFEESPNAFFIKMKEI